MRSLLAGAVIALGFGTSPFTAEARQDDPLPSGMRSDYSSACEASVTCTREVFLDLAFPLSADGTARQTHLRKWQKPISVSFATEAETATSQGDIDEIEGKLDDVIKGLSSIDIDISRAPLPPSSDRGSLVVLGFERLGETAGDIVPELAAVAGLDMAYEGAAGLHRGNGDEICSVSLIWSDADEILVGIVLVDLTKSVDAINGCLAHIVASAMGFLGTPSIAGLNAALDREFRQRDLLSFDELLLQILQDPIMKPGMTLQEVKAVFHHVYERYRPWQLQPPETLEPIDRHTLSCMASIDCAREHFLDMAVIGSTLEPKELEQRVLIKVEIPTAMALIEGEGIEPEEREAAMEGFRDALDLARTLRLPVYPSTPHYPPEFTGIRAYLSRDHEADSVGRFAPWFTSDQHRWQYDHVWEMLRAERTDPSLVVCRAWYALQMQPRYGLHSASAAIPADNMPLEAISRCVFEEIVQSFGLPTDIEAPVQTLFDDRADNARITAFDLLMFALLYHPSMQSGMRLDQVVAVFDSTYYEVWAQFLSDPALRPIMETASAGN